MPRKSTKQAAAPPTSGGNPYTDMPVAELQARYNQLILARLVQRTEERGNRSWAAAPVNNNIDRFSVSSRHRAAIVNRNALPWQIRNEPVGLSDEAGYLDLRSVRNRARMLARDNGVAQAMLRAWREYVVMDSGFGFQATTTDAPAPGNGTVTGDPGSGIGEMSADEWNKRAHDLCHQELEVMDARGDETMEYLRGIVNAEARDSDAIVIEIDPDDADPQQAGRTQALEGHRIRTPTEPSPDTPAGARIVDGVEINAIGRPVAYHLSAHDVDEAGPDMRIDAKDCYFLPRQRSFSGTRGISMFAQNADNVDFLDGIIEATGVKERLAACIGYAWKHKDPAGWLKAQPYGATDVSGVQHKEVNAAPGMTVHIGQDEELKILEGLKTAESLATLVTTYCRLIGAPVGLPMELILLDMTDSSFAGMRAVLLASHVTFKIGRHQLAHRLLRPWWKRRVDRFVAQGKLPARPDQHAHRWAACQFPLIDPESDLKAQLLERDACWTTLVEQLAIRGKSFPQWLGEQKYVLESLRAAKIPITHLAYTMDFDQQSRPGGRPGAGGENAHAIDALAAAVQELQQSRST